ncbi:SDR family oxidoreductase [Mycobacterium sp. ACS4331]|uniref:SDR family oxidoreductase n=1 Tax=Mycobacterium sp. ACS4331 TaxID=1834121 RepID=UPI0007FD0FEC|nr:SDR family oxidoreductase [Mycobacterium sp. ACS4331]OBF29698.1 NAD(P)-dependent oxidoreductase [Mycobacterium sp. ACS4331]
MIVITGASGQLGRLVIETVLEKGYEAGDIVAAARTPEKAADLADRGVQVRFTDYDEPDTLARAFDGADKVLLVSGNDPVRRVSQHRAVVDAAAAAGVGLLVYTSFLHADSAPLALAPDHKVTEEYIRDSLVPFSILRNGQYTENVFPAVHQALQAGVILGSARDGRTASAARADYAAAAAAVLTGDGHENTAYELTGDTAWSRAELAAMVTELSGKTIVYQDLPSDEYAKILCGAGLPEPVADLFARTDVDIADGYFAETTGELSRLIGRPTTTLRESLLASVGN